jgi:hypothetical protein
MTLPKPKARGARRVIRLNRLSEFTGNKPTQNHLLIQLLTELGLLHPYSLSPGGRAKIVEEDEIIELQDAAREAGGLAALIAKVRAKRGAV